MPVESDEVTDRGVRGIRALVPLRSDPPATVGNQTSDKQGKTTFEQTRKDDFCGSIRDHSFEVAWIGFSNVTNRSLVGPSRQLQEPFGFLPQIAWKLAGRIGEVTKVERRSWFSV